MCMLSTKLTPPAPLKMLQISPTTSPQKDEIFSVFWQSFMADLCPACPSKTFKSFISADVTATPIMSKTTLIKIKKNITKIERKTGKVGKRLCEITLKRIESEMERTKVLLAQRRLCFFIQNIILFAATF